MNVDKINKVKEFYSKKLKLENKSNKYKQKPFFTKIMKKLGK